MKTYIIISGILFMAMFISVTIAKVIYGGSTIMPFWLFILYFSIIINTLVAFVCLMINFDKIFK